MTKQRASLSPEELHYSLRLIRYRNWVMLVVAGAIVIWVFAYLLFGEIPITAKGNALFLTTGTVKSFESTGSGQIKKWYVKVGDFVKEGQILADLEQPIITKDLELARRKLEDAIKRTGELKKLSDRFIQLEKAAIERKRATIELRIKVIEEQVATSRKIANKTYVEALALLQKQEENLTLFQALHKKRYKDVIANLREISKLRADNLATEDEIVDANEKKVNQQLKLADVDLRFLHLFADRLKAKEALVDSENRITLRENFIKDLREDLQELINRKTKLDQFAVETEAERRMERQDLKRLVERYESELKENKEIVSSMNGQIIELTAGEGKMIVKGQRLGAIDSRRKGDALEAIAYFTLGEGKKIEPGMTIRLTPAAVERERFGSVIGTVYDVSIFSVSEQAVTKVVGNAKVAATLTKGGRYIQVKVKLARDGNSTSGYQWDLSGGSEVKLTTGTLASALVHLEERAPITLLLPIGQD